MFAHVPSQTDHPHHAQVSPSPVFICTSPSPEDSHFEIYMSLQSCFLLAFPPMCNSNNKRFTPADEVMAQSPKAPFLLLSISLGFLRPHSDSGREAIHVTVPDTITMWKAMTFCTSQASGFGLSPTVGFTAFKPFFVDLTLPYSVVRGESFRLTAIIFNYLKDCIRVRTGATGSRCQALEPCSATLN